MARDWRLIELDVDEQDRKRREYHLATGGFATEPRVPSLLYLLNRLDNYLPEFESAIRFALEKGWHGGPFGNALGRCQSLAIQLYEGARTGFAIPPREKEGT
jgi:hypothetical protein